MNITILQDAEERKQQYINTLSFFLRETGVPIVFVENSNTDISSLFKEYIDKRRLEYITFDGNNYEKSRGKGLGEALIMQKAIRESLFIRKADFVIKITGRVKVTNIQAIIKQVSQLKSGNNLWCDFYAKKFIPTMVFAFTPKHFYSFWQDNYHRLDDSKREIYEKIFYEYALLKDLKVSPFSPSPQLDGICGGLGHRYENRPRLVALRYNCYGMLQLSKNKKLYFRSAFWYFIFHILYQMTKSDQYIYNDFLINYQLR